MPWKHASKVKETVTPYTDELVDCMSTVAQYIFDTYGKFPATVPTIALTGYVQAQHIHTDFYDEHFEAGAYLETHAAHMQRWHHATASDAG